MGGKRKAESNGQAEAEDGEAEESSSPARSKQTSAQEAESEGSGTRPVRNRKSTERFDLDNASKVQQSPASAKRAKGAKKCEPTVSDYTPDEKEPFGTFIVQVENEWRDVKGFRVFEYKGTAKELAKDGKTHFGKLREWYCSKQVEPPGGFKPGQQIVGEQDKVAEAYEKHPPDVNDAPADDENEEEEEAADEDEDEDKPKKTRTPKAKAEKKAPTPKSKGSKPQTAYMLFVNSKRPELMEENPGITMPKLGVLCGEMWRGMSEEEKKEWVDKASALKAQKAAEKGSDDAEEEEKPKKPRRSRGKGKAAEGEGGEGGDAAEEGDAGADGAEAAEDAGEAGKDGDGAGEGGVEGAGASNGAADGSAATAEGDAAPPAEGGDGGAGAAGQAAPAAAGDEGGGGGEMLCGEQGDAPFSEINMDGDEGTSAMLCP